MEQIAGSLCGIGGASVTLPAAIEQAVEDTGFWASIPLWLVTILGSLFITVLSFIMIMTVYQTSLDITITLYLMICAIKRLFFA